MPLLFRRLALALALCMPPAAATAAPIPALDVAFLNSNLTFGSATFLHTGYDLSYLTIHGVDYFGEFIDTVFSTSGGSLVQTTPVFDASNTLIRTDYLYEGGTFSVEFRSAPYPSPPDGIFTAPIVSLAISAEEPLDPYGTGGTGSSVLVDYVIGPGAFDPAFASFLGVPARTGDSEFAFSWMLLLFGDHSSLELEADDGGTSFIVTAAPVSEPALNVLLGLGLAAVALLRRPR